MAVRGREGQMGWGTQQKESGGKEGIERVCCHCVTAFVAENYAICLSERVICSRSRAVRLSLTHPGPH